MESLLQKIQKNWETYQLALPENKQKNRNSQKGPLEVIVCVSGGSDSVALFCLLQQEIMHNFINSQTELKLSYTKLQNIFELIHTDNNNWQFLLSKKWSIFRSVNNLELHLNSES